MALWYGVGTKPRCMNSRQALDVSSLMSRLNLVQLSLSFEAVPRFCLKVRRTRTPGDGGSLDANLP